MPIASDSTRTPIDLTGASIVGDVDLANAAAKATFQIPNLLNLSGEVIVVDGTTYLRTSLTGAKYRVTDAGQPAARSDDAPRRDPFAWHPCSRSPASRP